MNIGDKIKDTYLASNTFNTPGHEFGVVVAHPTDFDKVVVVFPDSARVGNLNDEPHDMDSDWVIVDSVREAWDAVDAGVRETIQWMMGPMQSGPYSIGPQKIRAIKLLRAVSGLGLSDAKRAVENFIE